MQNSEREMVKRVTELAVAYKEVATDIPVHQVYKEIGLKNNLGISRLMYIVLYELNKESRKRRKAEIEVDTLLYRIGLLEKELKQSRKGRIQKGEKRAYKDSVNKDIIESRRKGETYREIAGKLGISVGTVSNRIKEHEKKLEEYKKLGLGE